MISSPYCIDDDVYQKLASARRVWLFLDYDGTLAEFAPTPDHVHPDPELIALLDGLARHPAIRLAVVSGRRLAHVEALAPVEGILRAGTYGVEMRLPDGRRLQRVRYERIRPALEDVKAGWQALLAGRQGFYLEDKGWALAIHAKNAHAAEAEEVLPEARRLAERAVAQAGDGEFRLLGGHKFLEIGPALAHKGQTVTYLLQEQPWPGALPVYLGDDDKDEEAFSVIQDQGGIAILVGGEGRPTLAHCRLPSPPAARAWLAALLDALPV